MHTPNKGRGSVERIVQKLPINKDNMKETPSAPVRNIEQLIQQTQNISTEPTRAIQQQQQPTITQIIPNIDDRGTGHHPHRVGQRPQHHARGTTNSANDCSTRTPTHGTHKDSKQGYQHLHRALTV